MPALQLPDASSLQRTVGGLRQVERSSWTRRACRYVSSVMGYSMLSGVNATYSSFFFISLKPWDERKTPETSYDGIKAHLRRRCRKFPRASRSRSRRLLFPAWVHPAASLSSLKTASGGGIDFLAKNTQIFMAEARKRPELAGRDDHGPVRRSAGRRQGGQRQGHDTADPAERALPDDADVHGRLAGQLLQPLRPAVAGVRAGGRRLPHQGRKSRASSTSATPPATWSR